MARSQKAWPESLPDVVPTGVCAAAKTHRAIAVEELLEESTAGQPHPAACIHTEICIQEQLIKYLDRWDEQPVSLGTCCYGSFQVTTAPQGATSLLPRAGHRGCGGDLLDPGIPPHPPAGRGLPFTSAERALTRTPLSQLTQRSPRVRKQATACRARWWIQPSCLSWVMMASIQGKPVLPSAHLARASGLRSQGIWMQMGFPSMRSNLGLLVAAV